MEGRLEHDLARISDNLIPTDPMTGKRPFIIRKFAKRFELFCKRWETSFAKRCGRCSPCFMLG